MDDRRPLFGHPIIYTYGTARPSSEYDILLKATARYIYIF